MRNSPEKYEKKENSLKLLYSNFKNIQREK